MSISVTTNVVDVTNRLKKEWLSPEAQERLNGDIANTMRNDMSLRIHSSGEASDGSRIGTYAPSTAAARQMMGLQTSFVDLKVYGILKKSFVAERGEGNSWNIGFNNGAEADIANYLEEHFSKEIWEPTTQELQRTERIVADRINKL